MENRFRIQSDEEEKRLDVFLSERLSITRSKVKEIFDEGSVRIEGKIPKPSLRVKKGLVIEGEIPEEKPLSLAPQDISLDILYEDEYLLAINKPKGMVVHPSFGHSEGTLVNAILGYLQKAGHGLWAMDDRNPSELAPLGVRPGIVHRLDKGTTGVILIAKDSKTQEMLSGFFKERVVQKTYRAIVEGVVRNNEGAISESIGRHPVQRKKMAVVREGGRGSETAYKTLQRLNGFTYIEAYPRTGRTHQIRVHLAHIGHPVVGDEAYGRSAKHSADRPLLHAYSVFFPHPVKGFPLQINAPVPDDMTLFIAGHDEMKDKTGGKNEKRSYKAEKEK
jgi:23S rRNA pseudouridine1911/1915/1917 synthase